MENFTVKDSSSWLPRVEVSSHAVDQMSNRCLPIWLEQREKVGMGLMSFVIQKSREAYSLVLKAIDDSPVSISTCKVNHDGVTYVFSTQNGTTSLVTVYLAS